MKKILTPLLFFALVLFSAKVFSQTNLTWILADKHTPGYFNNRSEFQGSFAGFSNQKDAAVFCEKLKANANVASVQNLGKDAAGNYKITFTMKEVHNGKYYAEWLQKLNVAYIEIGNEKKSTLEIIGNKR